MEWPFNKTNYAIFGVGIMVIIIGYLIISFNGDNSVASTKIGPLMLFVGYCVIIPISIIYSKK